MKIGDKVNVSMSSYMYDADGEIVGETKKCWRVKVTNHRTMCELWEKQEEKEILFYKDNLLERGFTKGINNGCIISISLLQ